MPKVICLVIFIIRNYTTVKKIIQKSLIKPQIMIKHRYYKAIDKKRLELKRRAEPNPI